MGEQLLPFGRLGAVPTIAEDNVVTNRIGRCLHRLGGLGRLAPGVDANIGEVSFEPRFHMPPDRHVEWSTASRSHQFSDRRVRLCRAL
jgi:hypothetical protein